MISKEFISLSKLFETQTLCIHKLTKTIIISKHKDLMLIIFKVIVLNLKTSIITRVFDYKSCIKSQPISFFKQKRLLDIVNQFWT